jgi:hypothetical protein
MSAIRVRIEVPEDKVVKLPDAVPVGPAEIIVFSPEHATHASTRAALAGSLVRTSPPRRSDSTDLVREDRMR